MKTRLTITLLAILITISPAAGMAQSPTQPVQAIPAANIYLPIIAIAPPPIGSGGDPVLIAVGDVVECNQPTDEATAALVDSLPGTIAIAGDLVYHQADAIAFQTCYAPSWGEFIDRTRPAPGNHDYEDKHAAGYFGYFGSAAGDPALGYYSYDLGAWHILALNTNCAELVLGCQVGSPEEQWIRADLAAHTSPCTLAYYHHARFGSGVHGNHDWVQPIWQALQDFQVDVVVSAHDHDYERYQPLDALGSPDPVRGITEFIVGTGGGDLDHFPGVTPPATTAVRNDSTFGVLALTLHAASFDWQFVPVPGSAFQDSGTGICH